MTEGVANGAQGNVGGAKETSFVSVCSLMEVRTLWSLEITFSTAIGSGERLACKRRAGENPWRT